MRNIFTYLLITLFCLGTSIVFSDHSEDSNNGGHSEWGNWYSSNTYAGKKYTDKRYRNASDSDGHLSANTSTETTRSNIPMMLYFYVSWEADAEIRCKHHFWKGYYYLATEIMVNGEIKDSDYGDENSDQPTFDGVWADDADAYYSEHNTGPNVPYPHPSNMASDCYASGTIYGRPADMTWDNLSHSSSHIPW